METLFASLDELNDEIISIRRHLHQHPELSFEEVETPKYIAEFHEALGHKVRTGVGGNGVVAYLKGEHDGPTVALRADFDALPIEEETELDFKSVNEGVMHACGHDGRFGSGGGGFMGDGDLPTLGAVTEAKVTPARGESSRVS